MENENHIFRIRPLEPSDCPKLVGLLERVWGIKSSEEYWNWKYIDPPFDVTTFVTERDDGELEGLTGFWGREISIGGQCYKSFQLADVMADPRYRGGRAYAPIMNQIRDLLEKGEILYGFTNPVSHSLFTKTFPEFVKVQAVHPVFSLVIAPGSLLNAPDIVKNALGSVSRGALRTRLTLAGRHKIRVEKASAFPEDINRLYTEVSGEYHCIFKRNVEYLNWRFLRVPHGHCQIWLAEEDGKLAGYLVTALVKRPDKMKGYLLDWLVSPNQPGIFKALLDQALAWFLKEKTNVVETWLLNTEDSVVKFLKSRLFITGRRNHSFLLGTKHPALHTAKANAFLATRGDSDALAIDSAAALPKTRNGS